MSVVERERRKNIEILTINRPEARNAINGDVSEAMSAALDELEADKECLAVIITGAGDRAFSAGMDLKAFASGELGRIASVPGGFAGVTQRDFPKPLIAALNGHALAGGCEIMLACDMVVAAHHATIGIPEAKRGLIAGAGGLIRLPRRLPLAIALELAMTGEPISATRAYELGLVNRVVASEAVLS
jgi:enoyl-CoA hydratase